MEKIKWDIDYGGHVYGKYMLSGDYNGHRFVKTVSDNFWGLPLMYAKWCITRRYKILYPEQFKNKI
jgi:hypothetical protein